MVWTFTDIQYEKDREQALKDSETQKRAVFEGALDAVISMDNEGRVLEFNPAAEKKFGKPRYEVIGELLAESLLAAPSRKSYYQKLHQYLVTNTGDFLDERQEVIAMRSDNSEFPLEVAYCRVPVSGQPIFTVYGRDLTNLKPSTTGENTAFDREKLDLKTRAKTLSAMVPTCCNCHQVHVPGGGWVNLEEHIILQSDTPAIEAVCPSCESTVHPDEIEEKSLRVWAREFRRIYTD